VSRGRGAAADARFMARALALAAAGLGKTWPNPSVGAVFVRGGRVIASAATGPGGTPHAEARAIAAARQSLRGATLYVTLEPCAHHGRTPPCVEALLALRLARVVVAEIDPDPRVRGRSVRRLRAAGVRVDVGVGGRIAATGGDARWITGPASRRLAHALRDVSDAVLVGSGTVRADDPRLTCRLPGGHDPVRVVLAGRDLRLPARAHVLVRGGPATWVIAPRGAAPARVAALRRRGVDVVLVPGGARPRVAAVLAALGARGLTTLLVEGGGTVAAAFLRARAVDRLVLFLAPRLLGGDGVPAVGRLGVARVRDAVAVTGLAVARVGDDLVLEGRIRHPARRRPLPRSGRRDRVRS